MKKLMGGRNEPIGGDGQKCTGSCDYNWTDAKNKTHTTTGTCSKTQNDLCYCSNGVGVCN